MPQLFTAVYFIFEMSDVCTEQKILCQLLTSMYRNLENIVSVIKFISCIKIKKIMCNYYFSCCFSA